MQITQLLEPRKEGCSKSSELELFKIKYALVLVLKQRSIKINIKLGKNSYTAIGPLEIEAKKNITKCTHLDWKVCLLEFSLRHLKR